jgi:branched-chain amino acid transport system ATP-binding protein
VDGLDAAYGRVQVLWNVSLELERGEMVALVGANAAGKTTLLRAISGFHRPLRGRIVYDGRDISRESPAKVVHLGISQVPQGRYIFQHMTVADNLELGAAYLPSAWRERRQTWEWVMELFPRLGERLPQTAGTLSGGEQQMLAVARALMARPRVLLVDEPSLGLAPVVVSALFEVLREINRQGVSVLLVEQNVRQSLKLSSRAYVLENGRVVHAGPSPELLADDRIQKAYLGV